MRTDLSVLKSKQQKAIQMSYIFLKFYINQSSNHFLLFLHFPGLGNLNSSIWRVVSMLFLTYMKVVSIYYILIFNHFKFMSDYLCFLDNLKT